MSYVLKNLVSAFGMAFCFFRLWNEEEEACSYGRTDVNMLSKLSQTADKDCYYVFLLGQ